MMVFKFFLCFFKLKVQPFIFVLFEKILYIKKTVHHTGWPLLMYLKKKLKMLVKCNFANRCCLRMLNILYTLLSITVIVIYQYIQITVMQNRDILFIQKLLIVNSTICIYIYVDIYLKWGNFVLQVEILSVLI